MTLKELFDIEDKIALVTGACGQLGYRICKSLSDLGCKVIGIDLNTTTNRVKDTEYFQLDIRKKDDINDIFENISKKHKSVDILINNAGVSTFEPFEERNEATFDWVMDVNLKGTFFCIQEYVKQFDKNRWLKGSIINIASMYGIISPDFRIYSDLERKNSEVYGATKAGIIQMTKYFATHLADRNIRVNSISPGGIFNPHNPQGSNFIKNYSFRCPMQRMADDSEMIGAVIYFASKAASYTTGQNIVIDGGMSSW